MRTILSRLTGTFDPDVVANAIALWIPNLIVATVTVVGFYLFHRAVARATRYLMKAAEVDQTAVSFVITVERYTVGTVATVTVLGQIGVDVSGILASLGVVGLSVGFAARDTLSNLISGIFIFWDRPFVIGDLIEVGDSYGRVEQITMRSTRVVTPDGRMLAVPNTTIVNSTVASYTNAPHLRLDVDLTIGPQEDLSRVRRLLLATVEDHPDFLADRPADVVVVEIGDYNLTVRLRAWLRDENQHVTARFALRERMFEALRAAGVDMPLETIEIRKAG